MSSFRLSRLSLQRPGRWAKACAAFGVLLLVAAIPLGSAHPIPVTQAGESGGPPGGGGSGGSSHVNLTLTDAPAFLPANVTAAIGSLAEFRLQNTGGLPHTFTLARIPGVVLVRNETPTKLNAFFNQNGSLANVSVAAGAVTYLNVSLAGTNAGDRYEFVSLVPYQFQAGMFGFLAIGSGTTGPPVQLNVSAVATSTEWQPSVLAVNTSHYPAALSVGVSNLGSVAHTWWLSPFPNYNLSPANFTTFFAQHPPLAQVDVPQSPGSVALANFTVLQAGVYEYICTIPGHFVNGMFGFLYVGVTPPPSPIAASTAIVQAGVLVAGGALLGIGGFLAVLASFTGRFPRRAESEPPHH